MNDRADKPSEQGPIARLAELQVVQFISDALRAGQQAVLVTGRGQVSVRAPEAALDPCIGASAQVLHIRPPLPEPPELQEMIAAAAGIAGGREIAPLAMMARLLFADPQPRVILAIDDAHTLSHRSLSYLTQMTELLAPDAPDASVLQIVLAAGPAFLKTLAQPEFESFRNRLVRPGFETFQSLPEGEVDGAFPAPRKRAEGRATAGPANVRNAEPVAASPREHGIMRPAVYVAAGVMAMGCLAAIGYIAFPTFFAGSDPPTVSALNSAAPPAFIAPADPSQSPARLDPKQTGGFINLLIDDLADAVAIGSVESVSLLLERIATLEASASPEGLRLVTAMPDRFAARAIAAAAAGRGDEARRLERFLLLIYPARVRPDLLTASNERSLQSLLKDAPDVAGSSPIGEPPRQSEVAQQPKTPPSGLGLSTEQPGEAGNGDRASSSPNAAAPAPTSVAPGHDVDGAPPATLAGAAPAAPEGPTAPSAEQPGEAGNGDRAASSPSVAAPAAPSSGRRHDVDGAPPAILAKAAPTAADGPTAPAVSGLPTLAPVRVVLNVARDDTGPAGRAAGIRQALAAAGMEVAKLVPVDARRPGPSIGYYFQSDRNAAAGLSHLLEPLLGAVDPVALRMRGDIAEPGTIEIAVP